jgi:hypothetical protein
MASTASPTCSAAHVAQRHRRAGVEVDLQHRHVGLGVGADQARCLAAVGELHLDVVAPSMTWLLVSR